MRRDERLPGERVGGKGGEEERDLGDVALAEHKEVNANKREAVKQETAKEIADANNKTSVEIARIAAKAAKARSNAQTTNRKK